MPSFPGHHQSMHRYEEWGAQNHAGSYNVPDLKDPYHQHVFGRNPTNVFPRPGGSIFENPSRPRWPPSPSVEDEAVSLSHEYKPIWTDVSSDDEAQSRGLVDQLPLIVDADQHISYSSFESQPQSTSHDTTSLKSKSSNESFGPDTPRDGSIDNPDRRYVYIPQEGIEIPLTYDEPRIPPIIQHDNGSKDNDILRRRKEIPVLDTSTSKNRGVEGKDVPLSTRRGPSPYSYTANSGKSTFSGDYLLSPDIGTPKTPFVSSPRSARNTNHDISDGLKPGGGRDRAFSNSSNSQVERPKFDRHVSAMAYSGEPLTPNSSRNSQKRYDSTSDESDFDSDDSRVLNHKNRSSRKSFVHSKKPMQTPAPLQGASLKSEKKTSASFQRSASPIAQPSPKLPFGKTFPPQPPSYHQSTVPVRSSTVDGAMSNKPPIPPRQPTFSKISPTPSLLPDNRRGGSEYTSSSLRPRPSSRPTSPNSYPLQRSHSPGLVPPKDSSPETRRSSNAPRSRQGSPLPSPNLEHTSNLSGSTFNIQPPPATRTYKTSTNPPDLPLRPGSRNSSVPFPVPTPSVLQPGIASNARRTLSFMDPRPPIPINAHTMRRVSDFPTSPQAKSSAPISSTSLPPLSGRKPLKLPSCPRPNYVTGYNDWHTLVGSENFDVCPTCLDAIIDGGYGHHFRPSPPRPYGHETKCDFGVAWVRMAWLLTLREKLPHVNLLYSLANIIAREPRCPGKKGAIRTWYRLYDMDTNREVNNFDVCPACVGSIESIFPALRGVFVPAQMPNPSQKRTCDLRSDSPRFAIYTDLLEEINNQAMAYRTPPNMYRFVLLARQMASLRECTRDDMVLGQAWHIIPHLPEFTVCEECFEHTVRPHLNLNLNINSNSSSPSPIAAQFNRTLQLLSPNPGGEGVSCQLYSSRMRDLFHEMCRRNDFQGLRAAVLQRWRVERDLQRRMQGLRMRMVGGDNGDDVNNGEEMEMLVMEWKRWE